MEKLIEHTYGGHIYMSVLMDNGKTGEIDVYIRESGLSFKTTGDGNAKERQALIDAFYELY